MKKSRLIPIMLVFIIGISSAFTTANFTKTKNKHKVITGYTEYYGVSTDGTENHYNWTTNKPTSPAYACFVTDNESQCDVYVEDTYTPQPNTPIPTQYLVCPDCTQPSNLYFATGF